MRAAPRAIAPPRSQPRDAAPRRPASKSCSACGETKPAREFYVSRGRLASYCKSCQRRVSNDAYRRRRQDAAECERMRQLDRTRKRAERARLAQVDPDRERRAGQARTAAVRRLIAAYEAEYRALLAAERVRRNAAHQQEVTRGA
jgi:recombinational DNA repair protein (RecF pathway)